MGDDIIHILTHITLDYPFLTSWLFKFNRRRVKIFWMEHQISATSTLSFCNSTATTWLLQYDKICIMFEKICISSISFSQKTQTWGEQTDSKKYMYKKHLSAVEGIKKKYSQNI